MADAHEMDVVGDWQEFYDENSGRNYYANLVTRETKWEMPEAFRLAREAAEKGRRPPAGPPQNDEDGDDVWEMYFDEDTGRNYWYNTDTQETTWDNPADRESPADGDRVTGRRKQDSFASLTTPDLPSERSGAIRPMSSTSHAGETDIDEDVEVQDIGGKWRKVYDENSGNHYYYHVHTHETTWTMPPEWDNKLLMNHQDELAKARASSLIMSQSTDDFSLPQLLSPHQSSGFARYSTADESSEEEEDSDFSDEPEGPTGTTGSQPPSAVRPGVKKSGRPPPQPSGVQPGYSSPGSNRSGGDSMYGRGAEQAAWDRVSGRKKAARSNVVIQDFGDSDEEDYGDAAQINVGLEKSTEWQDFAKSRYRDFPMAQFAKQFFRPEVKGMFGSRTHQEDLRHTKQKLSKSLLDLSSQLNTEAVEIFRNILGYMGDRKAKKPSEAYVKKLLSLALQATQQIQDEVFCQVIKQTSDNPDSESNLKGWKFMAIICGVLVPSQTLVKYLASYLHERSVSGASHRSVAEWARYALTRLDASMRCGRRKFFPIDDEIKAVEEKRACNVKVHYLDGTFKTILVDSQTRVDETLAALCDTLKLNHPEFYGLYEMERTTQGHIQKYFSSLSQKKLKRQDKVNALIKCPIDRHLEKDERIMDVLASWQYGQFDNREFELVLKVRLMSKDKIGSLSKEGLNIHFIQAAYNVSYGLYPISDQVAWELSAIQCQGVYGPHGKQFWTNGLILAKLHHYLPYSMIDSGVFDKAAAEVKILTMHMDFEQYEKQDAHRMYIEKLNEIDQLEEIYGAHFFPCVRLSRLKASDGSDLNDLMLVGIGEAGLALTDPFTREITTFYPLKEILTYGFRQDAFLFVAGSIRKQKKWRLATYCGKAMNDLLMSYIQLKVSQAELQQSLQAMTIDS